VAPRNPWQAAFEWIRHNTPEDAIFAIDPNYMRYDDEAGFRAIAQRSHLADAVKDSGVVELFPAIGDSWNKQVQAQTGIDTFTSEDFVRLKQQYNVSWVVLRESNTGEPANGLVCQYHNAAVRVCHIP